MVSVFLRPSFYVFRSFWLLLHSSPRAHLCCHSLMAPVKAATLQSTLTLPQPPRRACQVGLREKGAPDCQLPVETRRLSYDAEVSSESSSKWWRRLKICSLPAFCCWYSLLFVDVIQQGSFNSHLCGACETPESCWRSCSMCCTAETHCSVTVAVSWCLWSAAHSKVGDGDRSLVWGSRPALIYWSPGFKLKCAPYIEVKLKKPFRTFEWESMRCFWEGPFEWFLSCAANIWSYFLTFNVRGEGRLGCFWSAESPLWENHKIPALSFISASPRHSRFLVLFPAGSGCWSPRRFMGECFVLLGGVKTPVSGCAWRQTSCFVCVAWQTLFSEKRGFLCALLVLGVPQ